MAKIPAEPPPGPKVTGPEAQEPVGKPGAFSLETGTLPPEDEAVKTYLLNGLYVAKNKADGNYYLVQREADPKSKEGYYLTLKVYNKNPFDAKGKLSDATPTKSYNKAFYVEEKQTGEFKEFSIFDVKGGQKLPDQELQGLKKRTKIPNDLGKLKAEDPAMFKMVMDAFIKGMAFKIMKDMRKSAKKRMKENE